MSFRRCLKYALRRFNYVSFWTWLFIFLIAWDLIKKTLALILICITTYRKLIKIINGHLHVYLYSWTRITCLLYIHVHLYTHKRFLFEKQLWISSWVRQFMHRDDKIWIRRDLKGEEDILEWILSMKEMDNFAGMSEAARDPHDPRITEMRRLCLYYKSLNSYE